MKAVDTGHRLVLAEVLATKGGRGEEKETETERFLIPNA